MPRLSPRLIHQAFNISPDLAALLPVCRTIPSTHNELRWITQHVESQPSLLGRSSRRRTGAVDDWQVSKLCRARGRGVPLQYVLGTQPFGDLEIKCRRGVLIPRPEPEAYTIHLANLILGGLLGPAADISVLDLCTGTGCIALLMYSTLQRGLTRTPGLALPHLENSPRVHVTGIDISPAAVSLSNANLRHNFTSTLAEAAAAVTFQQGDIFSESDTARLISQCETTWDVLVCNPPYISTSDFARVTERSVRNHEPKIAQVPDVPLPSTRPDDWRAEDVFYARLLEIAWVRMKTPPKVMLFEVGDLEQAVRVAEMALRHGFSSEDGQSGRVVVEIWRDWPDAMPDADEDVTIRVEEREIQIRGSGRARSVFIHLI